MSNRNEQLFERAQRHIPGGVNSPVRAFRSVGGAPRFFVEGRGPRVTDADGKSYLDYVGSWGPLILGHAHPEVVRAVQETAAKGLSFGAPTELEVDMADLLCELLPSLDMVRLVSSGTEATMSAIRLARGYTGRDALIKFEGCYHGHSDSLLVKAGSGMLTFGNPDSGGVPADLAQHTLVLAYNDVAQLEAAFAEHGARIAAVIVEPVVGNMNLVAPTAEFLKAMRDLCTRNGSVLIFDEVMTGFRVGPQCAQGHYGITPDLTTLGKVIGGGMPVGAFGGKREIMELFDPTKADALPHAGTFNNNALTMAAGVAGYGEVYTPEAAKELNERGERIRDRLNAICTKNKVAFQFSGIGSMMTAHATTRPIKSAADIAAGSQDAKELFFFDMSAAGIWIARRGFVALNVMIGEAEADRFVAAVEEFVTTRKALLQA